MIRELINNNLIQDKVSKMQYSYQQFHNIDNYAAVMNTIYSEMMV